MGVAPAVERVVARIKAPITARLRTKPASTGNVWKISVVGTRNRSNKEAPILVLGANTNRMDPAINTTIATMSKKAAKGSGMPRETMKLTVEAYPVTFPGTAMANRKATNARPTKSKNLTLSAAGYDICIQERLLF